MSSKDRVIRHIFCKKCHKVAGQVEVTKEGTKIMQGGKTIISLGATMGNTVSIQCISGHKVEVGGGGK